VGSYPYTALSSGIPAIPLISITLTAPGDKPALSLECQAIPDTGSDCTLIPFDFLAKIKAQVNDRAIRIPVGGQVTLAVPYLVSLVFDRYTYQVHQVYGCPIETIGELLIIGRDILNLHRIEFDGQNQIFTVF
jgi:hypothetical protein